MLIDDDSPVVIWAMCSVVAPEPNLAFVGAASNGPDAMAVARTGCPDLILLDLKLPMMDGMETASHLGWDCPAARGVAVTAVHDTQEIRKLCYDDGASGFISKGALKDELTTVVSNLFSEDE